MSICPVAMHSHMCSFYPAPSSVPAFTYLSRWYTTEFIKFLRVKLAIAAFLVLVFIVAIVFVREPLLLHSIVGFQGNLSRFSATGLLMPIRLI